MHPTTIPTFGFEGISPEETCLFSSAEGTEMGDGEGDGDGEGEEEGIKCPLSTIVVYVTRGTEIVRVMAVVAEERTALMSGGSRLGIAGTSSSDLSYDIGEWRAYEKEALL